ncbi:MAG: hypothetical protein M8467_08525 [Anaerolineae bacterium]|nr:hypothetical protein [Anaerolineae bacterium]
MMHGPYRIFERLLDEVLDEQRRQRRYDERPRDPRDEIEQEVKMIYARGEIDASTYHRLLEMAQSGQLDWDDLARVRRERGAGKRREAQAPRRKRDAEIVRSLNRLYGHRSQLENAQAETEEVLERLEADLRRLQEQASEAEEKAQLALPDEERARAYLATKQEAVDRANTLEGRIASLRQNLRRIEGLRDELASREAELKALEAGEQLAELEAGIREDLMDAQEE